MKKIIREDLRILTSHDKSVITEFKNKTFLIIGATGSILSYFAALLLEMNDVYRLENHIYLLGRSIDKLKTRYIAYAGRDDLELIQCDIKSDFPNSFHFDYIVHGASPASASFFRDAPVDVILSNVCGMINILEYQKTQVGNGSHSVFLSSQAIYGKVDKNIVDENDYGWVDPLAERSCYVEAKRLTEQMCSAYSKQYGIISSVVRVPYAYGPTYDLDLDTRALPRFIKKIASGDNFEMIEDEQRIQYTYTGDVSNGILYVLQKGVSMPEGVYNIGGEELLRFQDMIQKMVDIADNGASVFLKKGEFSLKGNKELDYTSNNTDRIRKLGWLPYFNSDIGLTQTIRAFI